MRKWWYLSSLLYLLLIAIVGMVLRYLPTTNLPFQYANLLHAHSHVAFLGWIFHALGALIIDQYDSSLFDRKKFLILFYLSQIATLGMFFSFLIQGYKPVSIAFSTLDIFCSYYFFYLLINSKNEKINYYANLLVKAGLVMMVLSSFGPWSLAFMKATHHTNHVLQNLSVYYYMHFQYNGFFTLCILGLLVQQLQNINGLPGEKDVKRFAWITILTVITSFSICLLSSTDSLLIKLISYITAWAQPAVTGWFIALCLKRIYRKRKLSLPFVILIFSGSSYLVKDLTQIFAHYYEIFSIRDMIIAYIHLTVLGSISTYILFEYFIKGIIKQTTLSETGIYLFLSGFLLVELTLVTRGMGYTYGYTPSFTAMLILFYIVMTFGIIMIVSQPIKDWIQKPTADSVKLTS